MSLRGRKDNGAKGSKGQHRNEGDDEELFAISGVRYGCCMHDRTLSYDGFSMVGNREVRKVLGECSMGCVYELEKGQVI